MHVSIMDRSPSKTASTLPSHRFSTYPSSPSASAFSAQYARKLTPCTRPRKTTTARALISIRNRSAAKELTPAKNCAIRRAKHRCLASRPPQAGSTIQASLGAFPQVRDCEENPFDDCDCRKRRQTESDRAPLPGWARGDDGIVDSDVHHDLRRVV